MLSSHMEYGFMLVVSDVEALFTLLKVPSDHLHIIPHDTVE